MMNATDLEQDSSLGDLIVPRIEASLHEAAHVVVAAALGIEAKYACVNDDGSGRAHFGATLDSIDYATICLASLFGMLQGSSHSLSSSDYRSALAILGSTVVMKDHIGEMVPYATQAEVQEEIVFLAVELYKSGRLDDPARLVSVPVMPRWWVQGRIQQRRLPGWRKPEGAIKVSRHKVKGYGLKAPVGTPNYWGNPYPVDEYGLDQAIALFRRDVEALTPDCRRQWLEPLRRAKFLMCWCKVDEACHADVLLKFIRELPMLEVL